MRKPAGCGEKRDKKKGIAWSKKLQDEMLLVKDVASPPQPTGVLGCGISGRLRWINDPKPELNRENFAQDEEDLIIKLHALLGNRWSLIAGRLPGRSENEVENYWNSELKTKLRSIGIDPNNHRISHTLPRLKHQITTPADDTASSATSKALKNQIPEITTPSDKA